CLAVKTDGRHQRVMPRHALFRPGFGVVLDPIVPIFRGRKIHQGAILTARGVITCGRFLASIRYESPFDSQPFDEANFGMVGHKAASLQYTWTLTQRNELRGPHPE